MSAEPLPLASPSRTMADIAALFLSSTRLADPARKAPVRQPPRQEAEPVATPPVAVPVEPAPRQMVPQRVTVAATPSAEGDLSDLEKWPRFQLVLSSFRTVAGTLDALREWLSGFAGNIGLIVLDRHAVSLYRLEGEDADVWEQMRTLRGSPDLQLARALQEVDEAVTHWLVLAGAPEDAGTVEIQDTLVLCEPQSEAVVAAYRAVKGFLATNAEWAGQLRLMVTSADEGDRSETISRLQQVISEFLSRTVKPLPTSKAGVAILQPILELPTRHLSDEQRGMVALAVADFVAGMDGEEEELEELELGPVLVEENAPVVMESVAAAPMVAVPVMNEEIAQAQQAAMAEQVTVTDESESVAEDIAIAPIAAGMNGSEHGEIPLKMEDETVKPVTPFGSLPPHESAAREDVVAEMPVVEEKPMAAVQVVEPPLSVLDIPVGADDETSWRMLCEALPMLSCGGRVLKAKPPLGLAGALLVDPAGGMHAWVQVRQDDAMSWGVIWHWAEEYRDMMGEQGGNVDASLAVRVHVLLPRGSGAKGVRLPRALEAVSFYRLRSIRWGGKCGLALLPVS